MFCRNCGKEDKLDHHQLCFICGAKSIVGENFDVNTGEQLKPDKQIEYEKKVLTAEQIVNRDIAMFRKHFAALYDLRSDNEVYQDAVKAIVEALGQLVEETHG
jgi:hypothetical protein